VTDDASQETARVDQWLWAVRLYHSRSSAASACRAGRVKVNGRTAKPAASVRQGDQVEARMDRRLRVVEVVKIIYKRVGAPLAAECLVDHSPPPDDDDHFVFRRQPGTGRPTKRERRQLDRFRRR
jgi:ribosome-associated heat shock protein Hsp15